MQRSARRSIYALAVCVLVTGCGVQSQKAKQIKDNDIRIIDLRREWKQLTKRKSDLQAERKKAMGKETPAQAADWKAQFQLLDAELIQKADEVARAEQDRAREVSETQ